MDKDVIFSLHFPAPAPVRASDIQVTNRDGFNMNASGSEAEAVADPNRRTSGGLEVVSEPARNIGDI